MLTTLRRYWPWLGLATIALMAWIAYHPGLSGGFLFDDFVNLDALGNSGPVNNWRTFWRFITSGSADPTGRPLALLSFLIDAHDWPAEPAPFLRTNVLLHLLNGALLFALLRRLGRVLDASDARNDAAALLAAGLWLLHPLFVSTTLYIVQREAMLPATFTLLGLLAYGRGRMQFTQTDGRSGLLWMIGGIGLGTLLALLCKANGILLPLLAWVLEATVYRYSDNVRGLGTTAKKRLGRTKALLLVLPSLFVFAFVARFLLLWNRPMDSRPWTIAQRVLTEPRVLIDYLHLLVVPRSVSTGVFNDGYVVSQDLWHPASTLPALLLIAGLIALGFSMRRRAPALAAALLFYFAGHLLESSSIPLELYFEHRNYLPTLLLFWPLARSICAWKVSRPLRIAIASGLLVLCAVTTWQRAGLWGKPEQLAALWSIQNPDSSRAQATAAIANLKAGRPAQALAQLTPLWRQRPYDLQIAFNAIDASCATHGLTADDKRALADALRHAQKGQLLIYQWIGNAIDAAAAGECQGLALTDVESWLDATLQNPAINNAHIRDQDVEPLLAQIALQRHQPDLALQHFNRALTAYPTPDVAARQASSLASSDYYEQALAHLDTYEHLKSHEHHPGFDMTWLHAKVLAWEGYWPYEMAILRKKLHAAIAERDAKAKKPG
jgi:tetratricopeptide (TPR) repeat protein